MAAVEIARVTVVKVLHAGREVGLGRFDEERVVIVHQHERVQPPTVGLDRAPEPVEPPASIDVIADNHPPLVSARHHMVQRTGKLDSNRPSHAQILPACYNRRKP